MSMEASDDLEAQALNPDPPPFAGGGGALPSPPNFELWGGWLIPAAPYLASEDEEMKRASETWTAAGRPHEAQAADLRRQGMRRRLLQLARACARPRR